jgi:small multidrug resistance family-3 protein
MIADGYRPDHWGLIGALVRLAGMAVIMYTPRSS